jgi:diadenosine tetraphosphate (Ap4A) HIT family hydrolase
MFKLDERIANDTVELGKIDFIKVLLSKDSNYPWVILVPEAENATEIHHLDTDQQTKLIKTIADISKILEENFKADKINVGALGNVVSQLHIHIVVRYKQDIAWPNPIWGKHPVQQYNQQDLALMQQGLKQILNLV